MKIALEGNIGAGKTTLLNAVKDDERVTTFPEPIEDWINEPDGINYMELYYANPKENSYLFQTRALASLIKRDRIRFNTTVALYERSAQASTLFHKWCKENGQLTEAEHDNLTYMEEILMPTKPDVLIYLQCSPAKCLGRVLNRARPEERIVDLTYLKAIHDLYENFISTCNLPVFLIDGSRNQNAVKEQMQIILDKIIYWAVEQKLPSDLFN